jgi:protein gp37
MGEVTKIQWCDATFNPWWGCHRVSEACANCYAVGTANRWGLKWDGEYRFFGEKHWREPLAWNRKAEKAGVRPRVFCGSMCDVFEDRRELDVPRSQLAHLIDETPHLDWLLLTKRPKMAASMVDGAWRPNMWLGTTAENQKRADERIPWLLKAPAVLHFVSCEPLLEQLDLRKYLKGERHVRWVITGAESGARRRRMDEEWVRDLRNQAIASDVPFFYKQRAESKRMVSMPYLGGRQWAEVPSVH